MHVLGKLNGKPLQVNRSSQIDCWRCMLIFFSFGRYAMDYEKLDESPRWYAIHTHPHQENRAESNLRAWKVEAFTPKYKERRANQFTGQVSYQLKPLFPRYIFARFKVYELLHKVTFTRGVNCVVNSGGMPLPVDDAIIEFIRQRMDEHGCVTLSERLKKGDVVQIKDGPLKNFIGVFEREAKQADRVMILLITISYQSHVLIERELVRKIVTARRVS